MRALAAAALAADPPAAAAFLNALFDHANWAVTELLVAVEELDAAGGGEARGAAQLHRRAAATADLAAGLLRLLEWAAGAAPALFLAPAAGAPLNLVRAAEVVAFGVRQLAGAPVRGALQRRGAPPPPPGAAAPAPGDARRLRASAAAELLAPYAGVVLALTAQGGAAAAAFPAALAAQGLAGAQLSAAVELVAAFSAARGAPLPDEAAAALAAAAEAVDAASGAAAAGGGRPRHAREAGGGGEAGGEAEEAEEESEGEEEEEIDEAFLDPIMQTLMRDPVVLPHSGVTVDRATIERHLLGSATDPFSRAPLALADVAPDAALRARIERWAAAARGG